MELIAEQTEVLVCLDLIPAAPDNSEVSISLIELKFLLPGMYSDTNEVPFLHAYHTFT